MRYLMLLLTTALYAQSPLTTTYSFNSGGANGGATYFELQAIDPLGLSIQQIDLHVQGTGGQPATMDVYIQPLSAPGTLDALGDWIGPIDSVTTIASPSGTPTPFLLTQPFELGSGCRIGIATVCSRAQHYLTPPPGTVNPTYANSDLELIACCASNVPFVGAVFTPRVINTSIHYTPGGSCPAIASCTPIGSGCVDEPGSFYELSYPPAFDLAGMKLVGTATASGYDLTLIAGAGFAPSPMATQLALGDDDVVDTATVGGTFGLHVGSNCWIATGSGNSVGFTPTAFEMLTNPATGIYSWTDLEPSAPNSGQVYYEEIGTLAVVTYDGVFGWGTADPNEVQFRYDSANGDFSIEWGITSTSNPEQWLVGYSPAGPSPDPGNTDISAAVPFSLGTQSPLTLACLERPIQAPNSAIAFEVRTQGIQSNAQIHLGMIGFATAPVGLGPLSFPDDCTLYLTPIAIDAQVIASTLYTWSPITLPPGSLTSHAGFTFRLQAATLAVGGFPDARVSNALDCVVGTL